MFLFLMDKYLGVNLLGYYGICIFKKTVVFQIRLATLYSH